MSQPIDFLILAPLNEERKAVLSHLPNPQQLPSDDQDVRVYYQADLPVSFPGGQRGSYRVVVTSPSGMGQVEAATATSDAIRRWHPSYVLLVGIAGGDPEETALGDVLIAEQFVHYEQQKVTDDGAQIRYQAYRADPRLYQYAQHIMDWETTAKVERPEPGTPSSHNGVVVSGDKVQAKTDALKPYRQDWPKLVGVEMEAIGVAAAAWHAPSKPGVLMIRGVSDLADANKGSPATKKWRAYACDIAAAYAVAFLRSGPVPLSPQREPSPPVTKTQAKGSPATPRPTLDSLRRLLSEVLRTDSDFMAFCLDFFPETERMMTSGMNAEDKRSLLFRREDRESILARLKESHPKPFAKHAHLLKFEE